MAAKMLASAAAEEGKCVASFPMYGFERRGMPVIAFTRIDDQPIRQKTQIYTPDCLVVIDPTLMGLSTLFDGLKPGGVLILNSAKPFVQRAGAQRAEHGRLAQAGPLCVHHDRCGFQRHRPDPLLPKGGHRHPRGLFYRRRLRPGHRLSNHERCRRAQ
jgi:hypothetical protein